MCEHFASLSAQVFIQPSVVCASEEEKLPCPYSLPTSETVRIFYELVSDLDLTLLGGFSSLVVQL